MMMAVLQNYIQTALLHIRNDDFYRKWYGSGRYQQAKPQSGFPFYSLYLSTVSFGQFVMVVVGAVLAYCLVITLCIHAVKMVLAGTGRETQEAKEKLKNVLIIAVCAGCTVGFVAVLVKAFTV